MSVLAIFKYSVKPGRMPDLMAKLQTAAGPPFNSPVMPLPGLDSCAGGGGDRFKLDPQAKT